MLIRKGKMIFHAHRLCQVTTSVNRVPGRTVQSSVKGHFFIMHDCIYYVHDLSLSGIFFSSLITNILFKPKPETLKSINKYV